MFGLIVFAGCGDDEEQQFDCDHDDHCLSQEACIGEVCVDAPGEGDSCPEAHEGEEYEELTCEDGTWQVGPQTAEDIAVITEPPSEVEAGESFDVSFEIVDDAGEQVEIEQVEISVELNQGHFHDDVSEATVETDASGVAQFELRIDEADTGYVLTATSEKESLEEAAIQTESFDVVSAPADADSSWITGDDGVIADGEQEAQITIELADEYGNPVAGVAPEFEATGEGNDYSDCPETDETGEAICAMTSTQPEEKLLMITDPVDVDGDTIEFVEDCEDHESLCSGQCVDTDSDTDHCGECDVACDEYPDNSAPVCTSEGCDFECDSGYDRCGDECVQCDSDAVCDPNASQCVACLNDDHCGDNGYCADDNECVCQPHVYTASGDETARKLNFFGHELWSFDEHESSVQDIAVDSDGDIYIGLTDGTARKLDSDGNELWSFDGHGTWTVRSIAVDSEGYVYTASQDETVRKLDLYGNEIWSFDGHSSEELAGVLGVAVDSEGYVYTASQDETFRKIDSDGNEVWSFDDHSSTGLGIAVDGDGHVYTASGDAARKLDSDGNEVWSFDDHTGPVWDVAVDADGHVYTASGDDTVRKLDSDGNEIWTFHGHSDSVASVAVDDDGNVYTASWDNTIRKLDSDGIELWSFDDHSDSLQGIAVEPGLYATYDNQCQPVID